MTDACWLEKYLEDGSEAAFRSVVERHLDLVYATAFRRLGNQTLAKEAAQEVFIMLARKAGTLRGRADLSGWLYKTALFKAREIAREEGRRARRESQAISLGTTMKDDDSLLKSLAGDLDEAMLALREKDRQALLLRYFEDKSLREVGEALGVGEDAAQKRVATALESLARSFRKQGYAVGGVGALATVMRGAIQAAPSGWLAVISQTAVKEAVVGASLVGVGALLTKLMSFIKAHTAAVCLALAAVPALWQWQALATARNQQQDWRSSIAAVETRLAQFEAENQQVQRRLNTARDVASRLQAALYRRQSGLANPYVAATDSDLYRWSEQSEYVRVPKAVLAKIALVAVPQTPKYQRSWEDAERPALTKDGTISPTLVAALDLSTDQVKGLQDFLVVFKREFEATARKYSVLTNVSSDALGFPHTLLTQDSSGPPGEPKTLYTAAFPAEGAVLERQFYETLETLLGSERAGVFWRQAQHDLVYQFNRFGQSPKVVTLVRLPPAKTPDSANFFSNKPHYYVQGLVASNEAEWLEGETRHSLLYTNQPPAWVNMQPHRLLPPEFQSWWSNIDNPQSLKQP